MICFKLKSIINLVSLKSTGNGNLTINEIKINQDNIKVFRKRIGVIEEKITLNPYYPKVIDLMNNEIKTKNIISENYEKKLIDSLKIVGLNYQYLNRYIYTLSTLEKKLIQVAINLLSNPNVIILEEPFKGLDIINEKRLMSLLQKIKEQYQKTIIIASNNSNILYKYTTDMIFVKNDEILLQGPTNEVYQRVDYLKKTQL